MRKSLLISVFVATASFLFAQNNKTVSDSTYTYLALGDSYTIGASVALYDGYPYQTVQQLRKTMPHFAPAEIIAKSGWTTAELAEGISNVRLLPAYDFVSLLIGVNNEYRGREEKEYEIEFEALLKKAIGFAGNNPLHVFVLSIPDWSLTPFAQASLPDAKGKDQGKVAAEINDFNADNKRISRKYQVNYIDVTTDTKQHAGDAAFLASDLLHPSGKQYNQWATLLSASIMEQIAGKK